MSSSFDFVEGIELLSEGESLEVRPTSVSSSNEGIGCSSLEVSVSRGLNDSNRVMEASSKPSSGYFTNEDLCFLRGERKDYDLDNVRVVRMGLHETKSMRPMAFCIDAGIKSSQSHLWTKH